MKRVGALKGTMMGGVWWMTNIKLLFSRISTLFSRASLREVAFRGNMKVILVGGHEIDIR